MNIVTKWFRDAAGRLEKDSQAGGKDILNAETLKRFFRSMSHLAPRTCELYEKHLWLFAEWCSERGLRDWGKLTADDLYDYLESRKWSSSTQNSAAVAVRHFLAWKCGQVHPALAVRVHRTPSAPQRTLSADEVIAVVSTFDTTRPKGIRDLAIWMLMVDTGLRAEEVVSMRMKYLHMKERYVDVYIKGELWEPAAFFDYAESCLKSWVAIRPRYANEGVDTVFVSIGGETKGEPLTKDGLRAIFRAQTIDTPVGLASPHTLRRTMATVATEAGAPSRTVEVAGRWHDIKMVERYTRVVQAKALAPYSPANVIMGIKGKSTD